MAQKPSAPPETTPSTEPAVQLLGNVLHISRLTPADYPAAMEGIVLLTAKTGADAMIVKFLDLYRNLLDAIYSDKTAEERESLFCDELRSIFWKLCETVHPLSISETAVWIWERLALQWTPAITPASRAAFLFLAVCYQIPTAATDRELKDPENVDLRRAEEVQAWQSWPGHWSKKVEAIMRDRLSQQDKQMRMIFSAKQLEEWIMLVLTNVYFPPPLEHLLGIARLRSGDTVLLERDIKYARMLEGFAPAERSSGALEIFKRFSDWIASDDRKIQELLTIFRAAESDHREHSGTPPEWQSGIEKVGYNFLDLSTIELWFQFTKNLPEDKSRALHVSIQSTIQGWLDRWDNRPSCLTIKLHTPGGAKVVLKKTPDPGR
ncbi:hypothetical protein HY523_01525 [Candidatus Berkelbacteria bacterium]|nr:hypothetical protein [Candidatus Berkelbacteria bacterium]